MFGLFKSSPKKQIVTKKIVAKVAKNKVSEVKKTFEIILPGQPQSKKEAKFKETIDVIHNLLKKTDYVDNVKADSLRKLALFLDEDYTAKNKEKAILDWLKSDTKIKVVKNLRVTVTKN